MPQLDDQTLCAKSAACRSQTGQRALEIRHVFLPPRTSMFSAGFPYHLTMSVVVNLALTRNGIRKMTGSSFRCSECISLQTLWDWGSQDPRTLREEQKQHDPQE